MITFKCSTLFDITATGVTGHYKSARVPFTDNAGKIINNLGEWNHSRNQQRNWETLTQIISLRSQVIDIATPECNNNVWSFTFASETPGAYGNNINPTQLLEEDCSGVPMLNNLTNNDDLDNVLIVGKNIWFTRI